MIRNIGYLASLFALLFVSACVSGNSSVHPKSDSDPFESVNRPIFEFNYQVDRFVLKPVAKGYRAVTNDFVRQRVRNVLSNLGEPLSAANHILQADARGTGTNIFRFIINSTAGLLGMFDVASDWKLEKDKASLNETFAKWCIPSGPYIVLPFFGPSTPRAATGMAIETYAMLDPIKMIDKNDENIHDKIIITYAAVDAVVQREAALDFLDDMESTSVDFYTTARSAYLQNQSKLRCYRDKSADESSYDFDFGIEDEEDAFNEMEE